MSKKKAQPFLSDADLEKVAAHFRILAEPMRLRILQSICRQAKTVSKIVEHTGATQTNVSKHLALLAVTGIVSRTKSGPFVYYRLEDALTLKLCQLVHSESQKQRR
jgi:DNA-binding transcriptional ArsR family regulator